MLTARRKNRMYPAVPLGHFHWPWGTRWPLEDLVDEFFTPFSLVATDGEVGVPVDLVEKEDRVEVRAEIPGMEEKDLEVSVQGGYLTLKGEKKEEKEEKEADYHRVERRYGAFCRSVELPEYVDPDKVTAKYEKGVLTVSLGKKESVKPRQIPVQTAS